MPAPGKWLLQSRVPISLGLVLSMVVATAALSLVGAYLAAFLLGP